MNIQAVQGSGDPGTGLPGRNITDPSAHRSQIEEERIHSVLLKCPSRFVVHRSLFTVRCSPFAVRHSLFAVPRSPFTGFGVWGLGFGVRRPLRVASHSAQRRLKPNSKSNPTFVLSAPPW